MLAPVKHSPPDIQTLSAGRIERMFTRPGGTLTEYPFSTAAGDGWAPPRPIKCLRLRVRALIQKLPFLPPSSFKVETWKNNIGVQADLIFKTTWNAQQQTEPGDYIKEDLTTPSAGNVFLGTGDILVWAVTLTEATGSARADVRDIEAFMDFEVLPR